MHTTRIKNWVFIHDGDPRGGMVHVHKDTKGTTLDNMVELEIPFNVLADFVADQVRTVRITELEQMPAKELLGL